MANLEAVYREWEKSVKPLNMKIVGDLSWFDSLVFEVNDKLSYQIGYSEEDDCFCFLKSTEEEGETPLDTSTNPNDLNIWLNQVKKAFI